MQTTIVDKQADGYQVTAQGGSVTISKRNGKQVSCHVSHFKPWSDLPAHVREKWSVKLTAEQQTGLFAAPNDLMSLYRIRPIGNALDIIAAIRQREVERIADKDRRRAKLQAEADAADAPLLAAMRAEESRLVALIPADGIRCDYTMHSDGDGGVYPTFSAEGQEVRNPTRVGWAQAIRPGSLGAFASVPVFFVTRTELDALKAETARVAAEKVARQNAATATREATFDLARLTGERQALRRWTTDRCMNRNDDECSFDSAVEWAMPDGSTRTTYTCCY